VLQDIAQARDIPTASAQGLEQPPFGIELRDPKRP
jgi:hypothetical protein